VKNIIVVGDSFCASQEVWPAMLANHLGLNLVGQGIGGASWWPSRHFLMSLPQEIIDATEVMVFAHTESTRIPTMDSAAVNKVIRGGIPKTEIDNAVHLYYKHILDLDFSNWAQQQWFNEINQRWGHKKICHLHCFPWSFDNQQLSDHNTGLVVQPNLTAISLNEISANVSDHLFNDNRPNHFNIHNNTMLAQELARMITADLTGVQNLNLDLFDQPTRRWLEWH
jgi:hypothetical protein